MLKAIAGKRVLLVEDEYLIAQDMAHGLDALGFEVVGPVPSVPAALEALEASPIDGAVLDINLGDEVVYPVADVLLARDLPVLFTTGYDGSEIPQRYAAIERCSKPVTPDTLARAMARQFGETGL